MIHIFCLTKVYNEEDIRTWLKYYSSLGARLHIIDNDSEIDVKFIVSEFSAADYSQVSGWANQYKLYEEILETYPLEDGDLVSFLDDDEFVWYNQLAYSSLEEALNAYFRQLDCLLIPEILMSTRHLMQDRHESYVNTHVYRRNDFSSQGKAFIKFRKDTKYRYSKKKHKENGHVPWINNIRMSDVVGSGVSKTTYGLTKPDEDLRLYHYHIKSEKDWQIKIARGSAATENTENKKNRII